METPEVLGAGTYAVVFRPPLKILDNIPVHIITGDTVGKVMLCEQLCVCEEWRISRLLFQLDPKQRFFIYPIRLTKVCLQEFETATGEHYLDKSSGSGSGILNQFIMPYAGETLRTLISSVPIDDSLRHCVRIANAIFTLLKRDIIHQDIHDKNLTILNNKCHIIDFGMAATASTYYSERNEMFQNHMYPINPPEYRLANESFTNMFPLPKDAIKFEQVLLARYLNVSESNLDFLFATHAYYIAYAVQHQYMILCTRHKKFAQLQSLNSHKTVDNYALGVLMLKILLKSKEIDLELKRKMETIIQQIMHPNPQARLSGKAVVKSLESLESLEFLDKSRNCITYLSLLCK